MRSAALVMRSVLGNWPFWILWTCISLLLLGLAGAVVFIYWVVQKLFQSWRSRGGYQVERPDVILLVDETNVESWKKLAEKIHLSQCFKFDVRTALDRQARGNQIPILSVDCAKVTNDNLEIAGRWVQIEEGMSTAGTQV
ncbi:hypothetical protein POX_b02103 [Penicillium oxalicum]|uniref:hypothetical protein n=1 Tax=Penicillium oxalicum TaxID=69781 RepID=UPI0020B7CABD|nr:hypothetical protein POX_b02103 [Penicillium oxalicum]KAI2792069.1 hypothetical protein POX_b02103 [Penicillium oxalicum]